MLKPFLLLIFFSLSLAFLVGDAKRRPPPPEVRSPPVVVDYQWDLFILSQQWPWATCPLEDPVCRLKSNDIPHNFTIQGLWPFKLTSGVLKNCNGSTFDIDSVSEFREDLDLSWPSLYRFLTNEKLWKLEWNKYGRCSESILDQTAYFHTAVVLKNQFDLLEILAQSGIFPNGSHYGIPDVIQAITEGVNVRPLLKCQQTNEFIFPPNYVLSSIYLCVDKYGLSFVDCPPQPYGLCGERYVRSVRFDPPVLYKNVLINSNATPTSAAIGLE